MYIEKKEINANPVWKIYGDINSDNYHIFENEIVDFDKKDVTLTLDFSDVPYVTSAAIRVLVLARKKIKKENLIILNASKEIINIFECSGFIDMITLKNEQINNHIEEFNKSFKELLQDMVKTHPTDIIYVMEDEEYTWEDVDKCSQIIASDLAKLGVKKGSHVGICSANSINWLLTFFAIQKLGAISIMLNFNYKIDEMIKMSKISDIDYVCLGILPKVSNREEYKEKIKSNDSCIKYIYDIDKNVDYRKRYDEYDGIKNNFDVKVRADDPAIIIFTSGSTGNPKGVVTSAFNRILSALEFIKYSHATSDDIMCLYLPMFHALAMIAILIVSLIKNTKVCICPNTKIESIINTIYKYQCTYFVSVPTVLIVMMNHKDFSSDKVKTLRYTMVGGEPIPEENMAELQRQFPNNKFGILYAMSEIVPISMTDYNEDAEHIAKTVGKVTEDVKVKIIDISDGHECKTNEIGEITAYSETAMLGYYKLDIDKQAIDDFGYIKTGDLGFIDEEGYLHITGRCKELIIRAGENISPNEIASILMDSKKFVDCKVVGVPDKTYGEGIAAAVIMKSGVEFNKEEIESFIKDKLAMFKHPAYYAVYDEFPFLPNGKMDVISLRKDVIRKLNLE